MSRALQSDAAIREVCSAAAAGGEYRAAASEDRGGAIASSEDRSAASARNEDRSAASAGGEDLDALVHSITAVESIIAGWDAAHALTARALQSAIEGLHKEAFRRLIRALKDDPAAGARLRDALQDPVVYGVLRFHGLLKAPLRERLQRALDEVGPSLAEHGGGVQLVAIKPPDTVEVRLVGSCHGCPASGQTLSEGVEKAIRAHCPEIVHIHQVSRAAAGGIDGSAPLHFVSPFALQARTGWRDAGALEEIVEGGVAARTLAGRNVLLARRGGRLSCFDNACAHLGMPLDMGHVSDGIITCSYHGFRYALETGECLTAPEVQLKMHAVRVTGNRVQVRLEE
jgi:nitrite reductase/ring-hydroxylating ferredoxin subunit/Fe-S cluster biogenesis protein NfuA